MDVRTPKEHRHLTSGKAQREAVKVKEKKKKLRGLSSERITVREMGQGMVT